MNEATNAVIEKLWGAFNGISGLGQVSHDQYKSIYLGIFKEAQKNNVKLGGDEIANAFYTCHPEQMKAEHKNVLLGKLVNSWREWNFFLENYETV